MRPGLGFPLLLVRYNGYARTTLCFGVMLMCHGTPAHADKTRDLNPNPLRARFEKEYPAAAARLKDGIQNMRGRGKYLHTLDDFNKGLRDFKKMKWVEFSFYKNGDSFRLDRKFPARTVPAGPHSTDVSLVKTPNVSFSVRNPNTPKANVGVFSASEEPVGEVRVDLQMFWRDFGHATYWWAERPLTEWLADDGFQVREVTSEPGYPELFRVAFDYDGRAFFSSKEKTPRDYHCHGYWVLDSSKSWAIHETWYQDKYRVPGADLLEGREELVTVTVQELKNGVAPRHVELVSLRPPANAKEDSKFEELYRKVFEFEEVIPGVSPPSVFTPQALGVKDPRRLTSTFLLINVAVIVIFIGIVLILRSRRRSRSQLGS